MTQPHIPSQPQPVPQPQPAAQSQTGNGFQPMAAPRPRGHAAGCRRVEDSIDLPAGVQEIRHQMTPIRPYRRALGHSRAIWPLPQGRRTPRNIVRM